MTLSRGRTTPRLSHKWRAAVCKCISRLMVASHSMMLQMPGNLKVSLCLLSDCMPNLLYLVVEGLDQASDFLERL
jgi:hypothetical protein